MDYGLKGKGEVKEEEKGARCRQKICIGAHVYVHFILISGIIFILTIKIIFPKWEVQELFTELPLLKLRYKIIFRICYKHLLLSLMDVF